MSKKAHAQTIDIGFIFTKDDIDSNIDAILSRASAGKRSSEETVRELKSASDVPYPEEFKNKVVRLYLDFVPDFLKDYKDAWGNHSDEWEKEDCPILVGTHIDGALLHCFANKTKGVGGEPLEHIYFAIPLAQIRCLQVIDELSYPDDTDEEGE